MKKKKKKPDAPLTPFVTLSRVEMILRYGGSTPSAESHPDADHELAQELWHVAQNATRAAMQYEASAAHKRSLMRFGQAPDAWYNPRPRSTSATEKK